MTGILGIGTDMLQLSRFQTVVRRYGGSKLASRICSPSELADYRQTLSAGSEEAQTRWLALRSVFVVDPSIWSATSTSNNATRQMDS